MIAFIITLLLTDPERLWRIIYEIVNWMVL